MKSPKFFICSHCGNIIEKIDDKGVPVVCCGEKMTLIEANTRDTGGEKHLPVVSVSGDEVKVSVGEVPHPMTEDHLITWVYLQEENSSQLKKLNKDSSTEVTFKLSSDSKPVAVYSYCNMHGLWKTEL